MWSREVPSPVGPLRLYASAAGLRAILWVTNDSDRYGVTHGYTPEPDHPLLVRAGDQLDEYFAGARRGFDLPLDAQGTAFQRAAWRALSAIPYGDTRSYSQQAAAIDRPDAVRAIGTANGANPISIVVPCHRVLGADGSLTGFGGGLDRKRFLLDLEARVSGRRADLLSWAGDTGG